MATAGYRLTAVMAFLVVAGTTAAGWHGGRSGGTTATLTATLTTAAPKASPSSVGQRARTAPGFEPERPGAHATLDTAPSPATLTPATLTPATLTPAARKSCPAAATACVDLAGDLSWLQAGGRITYGPVTIEPGTPGTSRATPRGTFHVQWKAGVSYISIKYDEPMPYAVFFAPGGVAFHGGSLTMASHGCVHLTVGNARYYHDHLPIGAEVVVF